MNSSPNVKYLFNPPGHPMLLSSKGLLFIAIVLSIFTGLFALPLSAVGRFDGHFFGVFIAGQLAVWSPYLGMRLLSKLYLSHQTASAEHNPTHH